MKLVRALIAAAAVLTGAVAVQVAATSPASAVSSSVDCVNCWIWEIDDGH